MGYFPLCIDIEKKTVLLVGQGPKIRDKIEKLEPFECNLIQLKSIRRENLNIMPVLVVVADVERSCASEIATWCAELNIPINVIDVPELCTFMFPSIISRGSLTVSISTGGKSPAAASYMRQGIEKWLPNDIDKILDWLETCRSRLKSKYSFVGYSAALKALASTAIEKDRVLDEEEFCDIIEGTAENM